MWQEIIGGGCRNGERGVIGEHVEEEKGSVCVEYDICRAHEGVVNGQFLRGCTEPNHAQVVLGEGACFVRENVTRCDWERRSERDVSQLVDNSGISHSNMFLVLFETV